MNEGRRVMWKQIAVLIGLGVILGVPFLLRKEGETILEADGRVVILSPHNEAIRSEFGRAFRQWYRERTGRTIVVDWRVIGGTAEIVRKIESDYLNAFRAYWTRELGREWNMEIQQSFYNRRLRPGSEPGDDSPGMQARRAFLDSDVSCGVDLFFGGGSFDFIIQAESGSLVSGGLLERRPEWFVEEVIPQAFAGESYWDPEGRWYGAVLATFGIIYNRDSLERLGFDGIPRTWGNLADPRFFGELALADPTKSGAVTKAFEMILQKEMQDLEQELLRKGVSPEDAERQAVRQGWEQGMELILLLAANARYFTNSATKVVLDVSQGDCAVGLTIDFYGRQQAEFNRMRGGTDRFGYTAPEAATTVSADPIGLFRGAPNAEYARAFMEFVLSLEGQKLWNLRPGTPGGPARYALRRSPIRRDFYQDPELQKYRSDPDVNDYETAAGFEYRSSWTGPLFSPLRYIIRVAMIDTHDELSRAWGAILRARREGRSADAEAAFAVLTDLSRVNYEQAGGEIQRVLRSRERIEEVRLSREMAEQFREQYLRAEALAEGRGSG